MPFNFGIPESSGWVPSMKLPENRVDIETGEAYYQPPKKAKVIAPKLPESGHQEGVLEHLFVADDWDTTEEAIDNLFGVPARAVGGAAGASAGGLVAGAGSAVARSGGSWGLIGIAALAIAALVLFNKR
jgi:hypothetical protein